MRKNNTNVFRCGTARTTGEATGETWEIMVRSAWNSEIGSTGDRLLMYSGVRYSAASFDCDRGDWWRRLVDSLESV